MLDAPMPRVRRFLDAARALKDPHHLLGREARETLPSATGLSRENVTWALENALEVDASDQELLELCARTPRSSRAHVLLSANVFIGALRAIAIGLASAPAVCVRPSRREPHTVDLLSRAAVGHFQRVDTIEPAPGEHCWAYGTDATMTALKRTWPTGVTLHAHGHGYGVVALEGSDLQNAGAMHEIAAGLAVDIAAFDQRGCLSPRVILVERSAQDAQPLALSLAKAMMRREAEVPMGAMSLVERSEVRKYYDTLCMAGQAFEAGHGLVTLESHPLPWILPPGGRVVHIRPVDDLVEVLQLHAADLTTIALRSAKSALGLRLAHAVPGARITVVGRMQLPMLDGPVDLRNWAGEISRRA